MSYTTLRGRWCDIIVVYMHAPTEDTSDDKNDSFYEGLERVFHKKIKLSEVKYSQTQHS